MIIIVMKRLRATGATVAGLALLAAGACGDNAGSGNGELHIVTSLYPLQYAAERIAGDVASVTNLVPAGTEPHDFELSGRDVATVTEADLVVYLEGFQPAIDDAVASEAEDAGFDVAPHARLIPADSHRGSDADLDNGDHDDGDHAEDHVGGVHDPHFWLDPTRLADVAGALADRLSEMDPDHAKTYAAGAQELRKDLTMLDEEFAAALEECATDALVTAHTAFGYLADRYGFEQIGIGGLSAEAEPSTRDLARIARLVREHGIHVIYYEPLQPSDVADVVAEEAGVTTAVLDPLEGLSDASPGEDYLEIMRANLDTLVQNQPCKS